MSTVDAQIQFTPSTREADATPTIAPPAAKDNEQYLSGSKLYVLVLALWLTAFVMTLDQSVLSTAIPKITDTFHTINDIGWYSSTYLCASSSLQPLSGRIFAYFRLKHAYLAFLGVFAFGSLLCGVAVSSTMLIIGRAIAGCGGAGLMNGAMTIIAIEAPPGQRPLLMGMLFALAGLGQISGPLIGGALTQHLSWRWCFYINLPITALTAASIFIIRFTAHQKRKTDWTWVSLATSLDLAGFVLFAPACVMLFLALQWGGVKHSWNSATIIGLLAGSVVVAVIFVLWEHRAGDNAMVPPRFISRRVIAAPCLAAFFQGGAMLILLYYLPLWFQVVKHATPTSSAVHTLPSFLSQLIFTIVGSVLVKRMAYIAPFIVIGNMISGVGAGLMTTFSISTTAGKWIGYQILNGAGRGFGMQHPFLAVQAQCTKEQLPVGTAVIAWAQFFGSALFVALGQTAFANLLRHALRKYAPMVDPKTVVEAGATNYALDVPEDERQGVLRAYNEAITLTYYLSVAAAICAVIAGMAMGKVRIEGKKKTAKKGAEDGVKVEQQSDTVEAKV